MKHKHFLWTIAVETVVKIRTLQFLNFIMKVLILTAVLAFAATSVFAQNPYEYVDDALLAKVGEIIFNFDQKSAGSRSTGDSVRTPSYQNYNNNNVYQQQQYQNQRVNTGAVGGHRQVQQQQIYRNNNNQQQTYYNNNQQQQVYQQHGNNGAVGGYPRIGYPQQSQNMYNGVRRQRQFNYQQQTAPVQVQRQQINPVPYVSQQPQVVRKYEEPAQTKNSFGYTLSAPEPVARVAEFHFTESLGGQVGQGQLPVPVLPVQQQSGGNFHDAVEIANVERSKYRYV